MQAGGFGGFSFREIAADVGIKSSSVHYHFPTKEDLAAAIVRRWAEHTSEMIDQEFEKDPDPVRAWTKTFREMAFSELHMKRFFKMCQDKLVTEGLSPSKASEILSTPVGAMVVANALRDTAKYDRATNALLEKREVAAA